MDLLNDAQKCCSKVFHDHMQRSRRYKGQFPYNWDAMVAYQWHDTKAVKDNLTNDIDSVVLE
ncbi:similar to An04g07640 [Aspergillus luchuensis]|uniref:Similar to An04g07640 n=1 Tax=Aspergillus kawachii TaxID=1069201 RepID=A0A146EXV7_ASPKA|nr:similar to An04g07640 [Aspergillus luchuensis]